ncbi:MAG: glycoside hydrolase family 127 protein, partial [Pirellulales bacterium]|nr:glycoside hydrolase family 127 protein [Pirellulales bacterium]
AGRPSANDWQPAGGGDIMHCCTGNGTRALYYAWNNILQFQDGSLTIHLLLNRASPWADVDSYVPYEGRVDVKVKKACKLSLRIPEWVAAKQMKCSINGKERALSSEGRYANIGHVAPGDVATLSFPIFERTDKVTIMGKPYTLIRKGNDVIHIDPPGKNCPLYQREKYREKKARSKKKTRFVAKQQIDW